MFVRWKKRKLTRAWHKHRGDIVLCAQLVECRRVDGKPRQKVIKYLGSIHDYGRDTSGHQLGFWDTADRALGELTLDAAARREVEAALLAKVPRPTPAHYEGREAARRAGQAGGGMSDRVRAYDAAFRSAQESAIGGLS